LGLELFSGWRGDGKKFRKKRAGTNGPGDRRKLYCHLAGQNGGCQKERLAREKFAGPQPTTVSSTTIRGRDTLKCGGLTGKQRNVKRKE